MGMGKEWIVYIVELVKFWLMENVEVFIRNALGATKWIILNKCKCDTEDRDKVLRVVDLAMKELDGADLIDLNKVWHQAKDVMPPSLYGGNHADFLCVHQFKPTSHPSLTHEVNCPILEEYFKANPNDWWCRTGDLLKKEHRELYWR